MKINSLVSYQQQNARISNPTFGAGYIRAGMKNASPHLLEKLAEPNLTNEACIALYNKLKSLLTSLKKISGAAVLPAIFITIWDKILGLKLEKKEDNGVHFVFKDKIDSSKNFDKPVKGQSVLDVELDSNGIMQAGSMTKISSGNYLEKYTFYKKGIDSRRGRTFDGTILAPARDEKGLWAPQVNASTKKSVFSLFNFKKDFPENQFAELFDELINGHTRVK